MTQRKRVGPEKNANACFNVGADLCARIKKFKRQVNWSLVVRESLEQTLSTLEHGEASGDVADLIESANQRLIACRRDILGIYAKIQRTKSDERAATREEPVSVDH